MMEIIIIILFALLVILIVYAVWVTALLLRYDHNVQDSMDELKAILELPEVRVRDRGNQDN